MQINVNRELHQHIQTVLIGAVANQKPIQVYAEAEKIRCSCLHLNIALEDIVDLFIATGKNFGAAFEIDPAQASESMLGSGGALQVAIETPPRGG